MPGVISSSSKKSRQAPRSSSFAIDWNHPLAQGLEVFWMPSLSTVPQVGALGTITENGTLSTAGQGTRWGAGTPRRMYALVPSISRLANGSAAPMTVVWAGRSTSTTDGGSGMTMFGQIPNLTDSLPAVCWTINADNARYAHGVAGYGSTSYAYIPPVATNSPTSRIGDKVLMVSVDLMRQVLYVNGVADGENTVSLSAPTQSNPAVTINLNPGASTRITNSSMLLGAIWTRAFSASEASEFAADPFCFLRY